MPTVPKSDLRAVNNLGQNTPELAREGGSGGGPKRHRHG